MKKKHNFLNIDIDNRMADCSNCGKVTIYSAFYKKDNKYRWNCGGKLTKDTSRKTHILTDICEKSKTAYCSDCGVAAIFCKKDKGGSICWTCLKGSPGKEDRKKAKLRALKKDYCEECGFKSIIPQQIDIHHIDGNHNNDDLLNLTSICTNCHRLKHIKTFEELDNERIDALITRRNNSSHVPEIIFKNGHKNTTKYSHILSDICSKSKTAYCIKCGLVSINIKTDKNGFKYWACNRGGKRAGYGRKLGKRAQLQAFYNSLKTGKCQKCDFIAKHECQLDIHHKDHNHENNDISNLICYCTRCHRLEHLVTEEEMKIERELKALSKRWEYLTNN